MLRDSGCCLTFVLPVSVEATWELALQPPHNKVGPSSSKVGAEKA